ncbi:MAG: hypothetical protein F6K28_59130, partial [Microcoleus sp. SIO2G3]|nr:hypothetical protein [Microcoleus sp. SIO2G3]
YSTQITPDQYQWRVNLVQYDESPDGIAKFDAAIALMRRRYPIRREMIMPFSENTLLQANFSLIFNIHAYS